MNSNLINSIGLVFDIIGVILLFKYGLPSEVSKTGAIGLIMEQTDESEVAKWRKYNLFSKIGLSFILVGFLFQLVSNFIN
ncbi:MAG: hypothetical protein H7195_11265 [Chryseobacterium sp.]|nr:hypothetical protein [Chryseobacterium sp.]